MGVDGRVRLRRDCIRASLAFFLPLGVISFFRSGAGHAIGEAAYTSGWAAAGLGTCIVALIVLEFRFVVILLRLVRARFQLARYRAICAAAHEHRWLVRFRIAALLGSTLLCLGAAEIAFRVLNVRPLDPGVESSPTVPDYGRNVLGIREDWDELPADAELLVAILGDSFVFGLGVEQQDTFCHLLESKLRLSTGRRAYTINLGEQGTAPGTQLVRFEPLIRRFKPDVVVHVLYPNDLGVELHKFLHRIYIIRDEDAWTGTWSYVLAYGERQIRYWIAWRRTVAYFHGGSSAMQQAQAWRVLHRDVGAVRSLCGDVGSRYCLVLFPWLHRLEDYLLDDVHRRVRELAAYLNTPFLDLLTIFEGQDAGGLRVSNFDSHPNPTAHRMAADAILAFLLRESLITPTNGRQ